MPASPVVRLLQQPAAAIMGIVNTTPDSFSDGGRYVGADEAIEHGLRLVEEGAEILDIGGESTRPGARVVPVQEELDRVIPVIEGLRERVEVAISIDTSKPEVMLAAAAVGADMINDVRALRADGALQAAQKSGLAVCLMHMAGDPHSMQDAPVYEDVLAEIAAFLRARVDICEQAGIDSDMIIVDPGIGFGKTLQHNLSLLAALPQLRTATGCELLVGVSRKSLIGAVLDRKVDERLAGSLGLAVQAVLNGAKIIRVHDVQASVDAVRMVERVKRAQSCETFI